MCESMTSLLKKVNDKLKKQGKTKTAFAKELNEFLPKKMRRKITDSRMITIYRWLGGTTHNAEAALAMEQWLRAQS